MHQRSRESAARSFVCPQDFGGVARRWCTERDREREGENVKGRERETASLVERTITSCVGRQSAKVSKFHSEQRCNVKVKG